MNKVLRYIKKEEDYLIELTKKLIKIPTINPPGENYQDIVTLLESECRNIGLRTQKFTVPKTYLNKFNVKKGSKRINLLAKWDTKSRRTLHFNGHYDVVPPTSGWKTDPFKPIVRGGKIFGRGAEDMKGTIACMLASIRALKAMDYRPRVNLEISFTPDEEIGGLTGFGWLVNKGLVNPDFAISEGYSGDWVSCGNKGIIWIRVEALGKSCHASMPYRGVNAFEAMMEAAEEFKKLKKKVEKRKTNSRTRNPKDRFATLVAGGALSGGRKTNIVPDSSSFSLDRRILPEESLGNAKKEIVEIKNRLKSKGLRIELHIEAEDRAVIVSTKREVCRAIGSSIKKIRGNGPKFAIMPGGTDIRFLIKKGIPAVGYSAKGGDNWHGDNEFVYIRSLIQTAQIFAQTISELGELQGAKRRYIHKRRSRA